MDGLDTDWIKDLLETVNQKILDEVPGVSRTFIDLHAAGRRAERRC